MSASMIYALVIVMLIASSILIVGYAGRDASPGPDSPRNDKR